MLIMASILIVDDSAACRNAAAALLRSEGHRVSCAENAWRGLTILESMPIDLVILDLELPGLNGMGFLKDVQNGRHRSVPVIVATAMDENEEMWGQCGSQVKRWLVKAEYSGEELLVAVGEVISEGGPVVAAA
jgi:two-component system chemotaxis sensor kinase CheA